MQVKYTVYSYTGEKTWNAARTKNDGLDVAGIFFFLCLWIFPKTNQRKYFLNTQQSAVIPDKPVFVHCCV